MGQFTEKVKDHLKRNWKRYAALGAAAYGYNKYVGGENAEQNRLNAAKWYVDTKNNLKKGASDVYHNTIAASEDLTKKVEQAEKQKQTKA